MPAGTPEEGFADAEDSGHQEDTDKGGNQSAPGQHNTDRANQVNGGHKGDAQGSAEEDQGAGDDGRVRGAGGGVDGVPAVQALVQLLLKTGGHQNGIIHRSAQLHTADNGWGDKGDFRARGWKWT